MNVWFLGVERVTETVSGPGDAQVPFETDTRLDFGFEVTFF